MKKLICFVTATFVLTILVSTFSKAGWNFDPKLKFNSGKNYSQEILKRDYEKESQRHKKITGKFFGASIDFQLGYGTTNANADATTSSESVTTTPKGGFTMGALLNINLFEVINFSTGLDFTKKNFGITIPYVNPPNPQTIDSISQSLNNSYMNIPMNINFGGMVSENIGLSFSGGPYIGFLLNADNAVSGFKDFDFGLNGILTGRYYLNPFLAIILGTELEYGGLNNLLSTGSVSSLQTLNWNGFTGVNVGF